MSFWLAASLALVCGMVPCLIAATRGDELDGLPALSLAGVCAITALITLTEAFHRQPFIDLGVVLAALSLGGSLAFIRFMGRDR
ncbi:MAG TPA: monovalent cation/H+ antiporter complex subunit F [Solirubrobacteraceae bacterium]|nr:monovalent cation/H+ antiporter complex subunit F [Solirubrobacteraceae bacterium]